MTPRWLSFTHSRASSARHCHEPKLKLEHVQDALRQAGCIVSTAAKKSRSRLRLMYAQGQCATTSSATRGYVWFGGSGMPRCSSRPGGMRASHIGQKTRAPRGAKLSQRVLALFAAFIAARPVWRQFRSLQIQSAIMARDPHKTHRRLRIAARDRMGIPSEAGRRWGCCRAYRPSGD
jgi:hypothetical protein